MFKFDKYPEIKKAHEIYKKMRDKAYKLELANCDPKNPEYWAHRKKEDEFVSSVYAKAVFEAFNPIKPTLRAVWEQNKPYTWEEIVGDNFEQCDVDTRELLFGMVEEEDPYILPAEYYIGKTHVEEYLENEARSK